MKNELKEKPTYASVWRKLSRIDVSQHVKAKGKGNFKANYLSWSWAWAELMEHYPQATYRHSLKQHSNGQIEVFCTVTIDSLSREMWLPVMDHTFSPIENPSVTDINKTKMRCLVKAIAMFGLGHNIYAGEDLPIEEEANESKVSEIAELIAKTETNPDDFLAFYKVDKFEDLKKSQAETAIAQLKLKLKKQESK